MRLLVLLRSFFAPPAVPTPASAESGPAAEAGQGALGCWLYLRGLGLVFLLAFLSLWPQVLGLIGSRGMMPAAPFLDAVTHRYGAARFHLLPTLFYFTASDHALKLLCGAGILCSALLCIGILELPALICAWACYLSFVSAGREFLSFQWDALLLESAVFSLPLLLASRPTLKPTLRQSSTSARWLLWLLLFRFMFAAGWAKIRSGDPAWREFHALDYHFFTQPLPTVLGYYAHQLPAGLKAAATFLMLAIELGVPFLIFIPPLRRYAFFPLGALQLGIAATGNYGFFNLLAIVLCIPLLPEVWLRRVVPARFLAFLTRKRLPAPATWQVAATAAVQAGFFLFLGTLTLLQAALMFFSPQELVQAAEAVHLPKLAKAPLWALRKTAPFSVVNHYGLFAVMTKERPEIIVEGSRDGVTWIPYEFKYKAGALDRAPPWNAPHQPRLDWQLWFAAMGPRGESPWFDGFCIRLLQGSPDVLSLLGRNPFPEQPPRYLRATLYQYFFTSLAEKKQSGDYFRRSDPEPYLPPVSLDGH
jgi:hypothetical protein